MFGWESEPSLERASTQFAVEGEDLAHPAPRPPPRGHGGWFLAAGLLVMLVGVALILALPRLHQYWHGQG